MAQRGIRTCTKCGLTKEIAAFRKNPTPKDPQGRHSQCLECGRKGAKEYRVGREREVWARNLLRFNITPEQYEAMLEAQGGACALCGRLAESRRRRLAVDHDHRCCPRDYTVTSVYPRSCGKCVRGLLCDSCNQMLGKFESLGLDRIKEYLDRILSSVVLPS